MRVCGIIAEYDPFHNGHAYHLLKARELSRADYVLCVLSCGFTQRGMPAFFSTHDRARMALLGGADLVLGMPLSFSCAQANRFAAGGTGILRAVGAVTHLSFGAEHADAGLLVEAAKALEDPDEAMQARLSQALREGHSLARAMGDALSCRFPSHPDTVFRAPNTILGICYVRELLRQNSDIRILPVQRIGAYHDSLLAVTPSATAVRAALIRGHWRGVSQAVPEATFPFLKTLMREKRFHRPEALDTALLLKVLDTPQEQARSYVEISEGLERRISVAARQATTREELIDAVKTRRYPYARINRALTSLLLDIPAEGLPREPSYARLLGFRKRALPLLRAIGKSGFPLISRPARARGDEISLDMRAEAAWYLGAALPSALAWQRQPVMIE